MKWGINDLYELGFFPLMNEIYHWEFNNKFYYIEKKFYLYKVLEDCDIKLSQISEYKNIEIINGKILKLIDVLDKDNYISKLKKYIRLDKISKLIPLSDEVPYCPRCGHNYFSGGYGICKWCIDEL